VALARALVGQPQVLLLDEPLGALDLKLRESMLVVLKHLQRQVGITFLYVTHDQGEALAMSDRLAVMSRGRIEQIGSPDDVYRKPATAFVAGFIGKTNLLECSVSDGKVMAGPLAIRLAGPPPSSRFTLSVRPEDIALDSDSEESSNRFDAVVTDVLFLGHEREILVRLGDRHLAVRATGAGRWQPGDRVAVSWPPEAGVIIAGG
jgi:spermidine/putrescine transport system ATP-binding protein